MLDADDNSNEDTTTTADTGAETGSATGSSTGDTPAKTTRARKTTARKSSTRKTAAAAGDQPADQPADQPGDAAGDQPADQPEAEKPVKKAAAKKTAAKKTAKKSPAKKSTTRARAEAQAAETAETAETAEARPESATESGTPPQTAPDSAPETAPESGTGGDTGTGDAAAAPTRRPRKSTSRSRKTTAKAPDTTPEAEGESPAEASGAPAVLFQPPETKPARTRKRAAAKTSSEIASETTSESTPTPTGDTAAEPSAGAPADEQPADARSDEGRPAASADEAGPSEAGESAGESTAKTAGEAGEGGADEGEGGGRRRRRRGGRRRRRGGDNDSAEGAEQGDEETEAEAESADEQTGEAGGSRRRRRRRRASDDGDTGEGSDKPTGKERKSRSPEDEITGVSGSTRLEAKKQRRREGREAGRRRAPIVSEAEFLARRESVERVMVIRQRDDLTQIAVLEDKVLVEHYVARETQTSLIGNVYLGRVQNVLPSMEAAFVDIGKGRNAVLYAGEVNWTALGHPEGQPRKIESVLSPGQTVLVQVTKDPIGHKGARLTGQVSLPGRFLVYVPDGTTSGISRKLPDTERNRLKTLLKEIVPDTAGVIVRTAAEGASEEELTRDVERLTARWADIEKKVAAGKAPELLYGEPDLTLKVVRDLFTEDFSRLIVQGDDAWDLVDGYVSHVAPDLRERLERFVPDDDSGRDVFAAHRIDEQIAKGLDRKVWLPSGGSLIIDRTEAMTVVDVNTGKFTGSGGNLEETVTKNNLEAAEEIVRQLRLRDIGGIIVVDFIDMVLESNRELVLRRLVECLGRDRTRHQVAEVTSLGLVQMTRKRIGTGLLEAFSEECPHCKGRGLIVHENPVEPTRGDEDRGRRGRGRGRGGRNGGSSGSGHGERKPAEAPAKPSPMDLAASRPPTPAEEESAAAEEASAATEDGARTEEAAATGETAPAAEATPTEQTAAEDARPEQEPPAAPRVVTTTRRRTARRPAGAPTPHGSDDQPAPEVAQDGLPDPARGTAEDGVRTEDQSDDRTGDQTGDRTGDQTGDRTGDDLEEQHGVVAHVPVKRKGARKR